MTATIVRQRLLRTGSINATANTATDADEYLIVVSERCSKEKAWELFVAYTPSGGSPNPVPKVTLKQLSGGWLICDSIQAAVASEKTSKIFKVTVNWKEIETSEPPEPVNQPMPGVDLTGTPAVQSPDNWEHTWSRRGHVVFEELDQAKLFYKGGYSGDIHTTLSASPTVRKLFQASNGEAFRNPPPLRRTKYVWNFRWIRTTLPLTLKNAEGKLNSADFTIKKAGRDFLLKAHTALIDSVELSSTRWNGSNLVEISVEIVHDPNGFYIEQLDQGKYVNTSTSANNVELAKVARKPIQDDTARVVYTPQRLAGDGDLAANVNDEIYSTWSDYEEVAFATVDLIKDLAT